jgi:hypothetical protein
MTIDILKTLEAARVALGNAGHHDLARDCVSASVHYNRMGPHRGPLNKAQKIVCRVYGDGDYRDIAKSPEPWPMVREASDGLFAFLMVELDDGEDCKTVEEAHDRVDRAINDLHEVVNALAVEA